MEQLLILKGLRHLLYGKSRDALQEVRYNNSQNTVDDYRGCKKPTEKNRDTDSKATKQMTFQEVGYTPTNLRLAIEKLGITQASLAEALGVAPNTLRQWLMPVGTKSRRDMPHTKWLEIMAILESKDKA